MDVVFVVIVVVAFQVLGVKLGELYMLDQCSDPESTPTFSLLFKRESH